MQVYLTWLKFCDGLENTSKQNSRFIQFILSLNVLYLAIRLHVFELFDGQLHCLVTLTIQDVLNALQFAIGN